MGALFSTCGGHFQFYPKWALPDVLQQMVQVIAKINYANTPVVCIKWTRRTEKTGPRTDIIDWLSTNGNYRTRWNFIQAFSTPKIINPDNRSQLICPSNSQENSDGKGNTVCKCDLPHRSGPSCMFLCDMKQIGQGRLTGWNVFLWQLVVRGGGKSFFAHAADRIILWKMTPL